MKILEKDDTLFVFSNRTNEMTVEKVACADYDDSKSTCTIRTDIYNIYEASYDDIKDKCITAYAEDGECYIITLTKKDALTYNDNMLMYVKYRFYNNIDIINSVDNEDE